MSPPPPKCTDESDSDDNMPKNTSVKENSNSSIEVTKTEYYAGVAEEGDTTIQASEEIGEITEGCSRVKSNALEANATVNKKDSTTTSSPEDKKIGIDKDTHEYSSSADKFDTDRQTDSRDEISSTEPDQKSTLISTKTLTPRGSVMISPLNELLFDKANVITTATDSKPSKNTEEKMSHKKAKPHQLAVDEITQARESQRTEADNEEQQLVESQTTDPTSSSLAEATRPIENKSEVASAAMVPIANSGKQNIPETTTLSDDSSIEPTEEPTTSESIISGTMTDFVEDSTLPENKDEQEETQDSESFISSNAFIEEEEEKSTTLTSDSKSHIEALYSTQTSIREKQTPTTSDDLQRKSALVQSLDKSQSLCSNRQTEVLSKSTEPDDFAENEIPANTVQGIASPAKEEQIVHSTTSETVVKAASSQHQNEAALHQTNSIPTQIPTNTVQGIASPAKEENIVHSTASETVVEDASSQHQNEAALHQTSSIPNKPVERIISVKNELVSNERVVPFSVPLQQTPELVSETQNGSPVPIESIDPALSRESDRNAMTAEVLSEGQADDNSAMGPPLPRQPISTNISPDQVHPYVMLQPQFAVQQPDHVAPHHVPLVPSLQARHSMPYGYPMQAYSNMPAMLPPAPSPAPPVQQPQLQLQSSGRRKIRLRLQEDVERHNAHAHRSWFRRSKLNIADPIEMEMAGIDRGLIAISWFEGTTSGELQEHVRRSVSRKMGINGSSKLTNLRIIDESIDPPEEIVLSSFIPDGSEFLLRFSTIDRDTGAAPSHATPRLLLHQAESTISTGPPNSPSAAPSPFPSNPNLLALNSEQLQQKFAKLGNLNEKASPSKTKSARRGKTGKAAVKPLESVTVESDTEAAGEVVVGGGGGEVASKGSTYNQDDDILSENTDPVEARLQQIVDLLQPQQVPTANQTRGSERRKEEKKQVIFVLANYFVLFLSLIAISAEIQARAPGWMKWMEKQLDSVQQCSTDQESLFECVSNGDVSGLIATFLMWITRSAATKRIFLFGFETPKKLWTVVYESFVTAFCWGLSYTFIRRGLNPDTRTNFLHKYWKDAVYGSLAGFNASFMKAVLKNLIPQEAIESALDDNEFRLKIFSWLPSMH